VISLQGDWSIDQKGETIDSIQYLLNVVVYRSPFHQRITVDTE